MKSSKFSTALFIGGTLPHILVGGKHFVTPHPKKFGVFLPYAPIKLEPKVERHISYGLSGFESPVSSANLPFFLS